MSLLLAVLLAAGAVFAVDRLPPRRWRTAAVAALALLPLVYAAAVLWHARARLSTLRLAYVGKQLTFGPGTPLTIGGSGPASEAIEDLNAAKLPPRVLRLEVADAGTAEALGVAAGTPVLRFSGSPVPATSIDGRMLASVPLAAGDRLHLAAGKTAIELEVAGDGLTRGGELYPWPGRLARLFRGPGRILYLPRVLDRLAASEVPRGGWPYRSFLHRPRAFGPWHLVIRDASASVIHRRDDGGEIAVGLPEAVPVPRDFELLLQVVGGRADRLETARRDRLLISRQRLEVRFGEPQWRVEDLADEDAPFTLGLGVPSALARHRRLIELDEGSPRFHGFSVDLSYDPEHDAAGVTYLGKERPLPLGDLYAFGEGDDQMLVRIERTGPPWRVVVDLALLALFLGVFFGRSLAREPALAALVAPVGLLLASRLLFASRAAESPPHFLASTYGEARLALWLVPAGMLFGWSLAWLLRRAGRAPAAGEPAAPAARRALLWPVAGLLVAGLGCSLGSRGIGGLPYLALLPWLGAAALWLAALLLERPRPRAWARALVREGIPWRQRWLLATGGAVLAVRFLGDVLGMPETLRLPLSGFRLLWTVPQLPLCALALALSLHLLARRRPAPDDAPRRLAAEWLGGLAAILAFVGLAFVAVAFLTGDTGLLIVHALPAIAGLLLVARWAPGAALGDRRRRLIYGAGLLVACLPLVLVIAGNLRPDLVVRVVGWGIAEEDGDGESPAQRVADRTAQLSSTRAQQLFRLYMLANPESLSQVGLIPSERVAIHYQTLLSYAEQAGWTGDGFASSTLPRHLGFTYLSDLVPMVFSLADFGAAGVLALALVYAAILGAPLYAARGAPPGGAPAASQGAWIAAVALLAFALPSLYMILANLNLVLFTGKNCNLLALNSVSDVLESSALLGLAAAGLGLARRTRR